MEAAWKKEAIQEKLPGKFPSKPCPRDWEAGSVFASLHKMDRLWATAAQFQGRTWFQVVLFLVEIAFIIRQPRECNIWKVSPVLMTWFTRDSHPCSIIKKDRRLVSYCCCFSCSQCKMRCDSSFVSAMSHSCTEESLRLVPEAIMSLNAVIPFWQAWMSPVHSAWPECAVSTVCPDLRDLEGFVLATWVCYAHSQSGFLPEGQMFATQWVEHKCSVFSFSPHSLSYPSTFPPPIHFPLLFSVVVVVVESLLVCQAGLELMVFILPELNPLPKC